MKSSGRKLSSKALCNRAVISEKKNVLHISLTYWPHLGCHLSWDNNFFTSYFRVMDLSRCSASVSLNVSLARPRMKPSWGSVKSPAFGPGQIAVWKCLEGLVWSLGAASCFLCSSVWNLLGKVHSIQQLTDWTSPSWAAQCWAPARKWWTRQGF